MSLFYIITNLFLVTNLITIPIENNYYLQKEINEDNNIFNIQAKINPQGKTFPLKKINDSLGVKISAKSVLVKDLNSDKILWAKNSKEVRSIASISKLMTTLVLLNMPEINWEKEVEINQSDFKGDFNKLKIYKWEKIKFKDLLFASLITSSNNGIEVVVKNSGVSRTKFIEKMNEQALKLGLTNTKFEDPTGLNDHNVSSAEELLILSKKVFSNSDIKKVTSQKTYSFYTKNSKRLVTVKNTNELIGGYLNIEAGKTGYTEKAGFCLVSEISYEGKGPILVIVLGSNSHYERFSDLKAISTWIFDNYSWSSNPPL